MYSMEHALTHVVQEFEQERLAIGKLAKAELAEVKKVVTDLSTRLATKTIEMRHIRVLLLLTLPLIIYRDWPNTY